MRVLDDMCDMLEDELKQIVKKDDINPQELDSAYKAIDILKDIETIKAMKKADDSYGYSQRRMPYSYDSYDSYEYSRGYDGNSNRSYARGGRDGDNDGRYNESRARGGGYSGHNEDQLLHKIEELERKVGKMN